VQAGVRPIGNLKLAMLNMRFVLVSAAQPIV
jgi:hypothetical protein